MKNELRQNVVTSERKKELDYAQRMGFSYQLKASGLGVIQDLNLTKPEAILFGLRLAEWEIENTLYFERLDSRFKNRDKQIAKAERIRQAIYDRKEVLLGEHKESGNFAKRAHTVELAALSFVPLLFNLTDHDNKPLNTNRLKNLPEWKQNWKNRLQEAELRNSEA